MATRCRRSQPRASLTPSIRWTPTSSRACRPRTGRWSSCYPVVTVDMGQQLARMKMPAEIATLWRDYGLELAREARADPAREATTVVIGIHPFVIGTPDGAAALRRVLSRLTKEDQVWLTDTDAILAAALK